MLLFYCLLLHVASFAAAVPAAQRHASCSGPYRGCFRDFVPAPGVPPVRAVDHLISGPTANMSDAICARGCALRGYVYAGITGHSKAYFCYCGCSLNQAATPLANATCGAPCAGSEEPAGHCGNDGAMAAFGPLACTPALPPSPICGGGNGSLPDGPACSQAAAKKWKFCDPAASLDDRVWDLVDRIGVAEAGALLTARESPRIPRLGIPSFYWGTNAIHGVQYGNCTTFPEPLNLAATFNTTVMRGVGRTIGREMRALYNSNEAARGSVGLTSWSPTINIMRDPRWGRNQETASEDPLLAGTYGREFSIGMQYDLPAGGGGGDDDDDNDDDDDDGTDAWSPPPPAAGQFMAVASLKHVLAYGVEQWSPSGNWSEDTYDRISFDAKVSNFDLEDTYSVPFRHAIAEGGAAGIMYACNKVNGIPAVASRDLAARLRSWGFNGYRTTDGDGIGGISDPRRQNFTSTAIEAIGVAMTDGESDIDDGGVYAEHLVDAYAAGLVNLTTIRRALFNTFQIRFRLGLFDPPSSSKPSPKPSSKPSSKSSSKPSSHPSWDRLNQHDDVDTPAARQLNIEASRQSLVLLQNRNRTLPFPVPAAGGKVVVVGPSANSTRLLGGGHYARSLQPTDRFPSIPAAMAKLLASAGSPATVEHVPGIRCSPSPSLVCVDPRPDDKLLQEAVEAARGATQVVVVVNLQSIAPCDSPAAVAAANGEFNPCGYEAEQHDRPHSSVPRLQEALAVAVLSAAAGAGVPVAVVLVHGGSMAIELIQAKAPAILDALYPGTATGGQAVADALYGEFSPAGKLPYSVMPAAFDKLSYFPDMSMTKPPGRTYRYYPTSKDLPPILFPFGFGLTYTTWRLTLQQEKQQQEKEQPYKFKVQCLNTGTMDSDEVVQVYLEGGDAEGAVVDSASPNSRPSRADAPPQDAPTPHRQLIDFRRVHAKAGEGTVAAFSISQAQLARVSADGSRHVVPGHYTLSFTNGADQTVKTVISVK